MSVVGLSAIPETVRPVPRSSGRPTAWVAMSTGTNVVPLAAMTVRSSCITTTAPVAPRPGSTMGAPARWVTRSTGMSTLRVERPGGVDWVTTKAHRPSGEVVTA